MCKGDLIWSQHSSWAIRGIALTSYVGTYKGHLTDQNILSEQPKALHSLAMLEDAKVIWLIRTSFLGNQRHCTHLLYWKMQRSFDWSEHPFWAIKGIALTRYVGRCKGHLTDQNILSEQSKALHSLAMWEDAKVIWLIRTSFLSNQTLTFYVGTCKGHLTDQNIFPEQSDTHILC